MSQVVVVNSRKAFAAVINNYGEITANFGNYTITGASKIRLKHISIPNVLPNVVSGSNSFTVNGAVVTLQPGCYSMAQLIAAINAVTTVSSSPTVTFALNEYNFTLMGTASGSIDITVPNVQTGRLLGNLPVGTTTVVSSGNAVAISNDPPDLNTNADIYISITGFPAPVKFITDITTQPPTVMTATFAVPIDISSGLIATEYWYEQELEVRGSPISVNQLHVKLLNDNGQLINQNSHWKMTLEFVP